MRSGKPHCTGSFILLSYYFLANDIWYALPRKTLPQKNRGIIYTIIHWLIVTIIPLQLLIKKSKMGQFTRLPFYQLCSNGQLFSNPA